MKYLHTMVRVSNLEASLDFYCNKLGLIEVSRKDIPAGRFTLCFLAPFGQKEAQVELTYNWPKESEELEDYPSGRNFGHLAFQVENIYELCTSLQAKGVVINRPPRDGWMAFVKSPDGISIELLQKGQPLPPTEPWASMENTGTW